MWHLGMEGGGIKLLLSPERGTGAATGAKGARLLTRGAQNPEWHLEKQQQSLSLGSSWFKPVTEHKMPLDDPPGIQEAEDLMGILF